MSSNKYVNDGSWSRLFGYDIFLSFALGAPPRGVRGYAADLARRLRDRGFTVYFSEDQAPPGAALTQTLKTALRSSRSIVVIANHDMLLDPRWVRTEVEQFRAWYPRRYVIPIIVEGVAKSPENQVAAAPWLPTADLVGLEETAQAVISSTVGDHIIDRIVVAPRAVRSLVRLRLVVGTLLLVFATLSVVALWQRDLARASNRDAVSKRVEMESANMLSGAHGGSDEEAMLRALAAFHLSSGGPSDAVLAAIKDYGQLDKIVGSGHELYAIAISPDGTRVATGGQQNDFSIRTAAGLSLISSSPTCSGNNVLDLAFSPDGARVALANADGSVEMRNGQTGLSEPLWFQVGSKYVRTISFNSDGTQIASGSSDGSLRIWDAFSGQATSPPFGVSNANVMRIAFVPGQHRVVSAGADGTVTLWSLDGATPLPAELHRHRGSAIALAIDAGGDTLISGGIDGDIKVANLITGQTDAFDAGQQLSSASIRPDGLEIATAGANGTVTLWRLADSKWMVASQFKAHQGRIGALAFASAGDRLFTVGSDGTTRAWTLEQPERSSTEATPESHAPCAFDDSGTRWICADAAHAGRLVIKSVSNPNAVATTLDNAEFSIESVAFSIDGSRIAAGSDRGAIAIWDATTGKRIGVSLGTIEAGAVQSLVFTPDGSRVVSSGKHTAFVWEIGNPIPILRLVADEPANRPTYVEQVAISRDGALIAGASEHGNITLWNSRTGATIGPSLQAERPVTSVAISPDGSIVSAGNVDGTLRIWSIKGPSHLLGPIHAHADVIQHLLFGRDGSWIASGGEDDTVRLFSTTTGKPLGAPISHYGGRVTAMALSADGNALLSLGTMNDLHSLAAPAAWGDLLCKRLTRNMSISEWNLWISPTLGYELQCPGLPISPPQSATAKSVPVSNSRPIGALPSWSYCERKSTMR